MISKTRVALAVVLLAVSAVSTAQSPQSTQGSRSNQAAQVSATVEETERVESETALLKARNALEEERRRFATLDVSDTLPAVVAIFGEVESPRARVISPRGTMYKIKLGDMIGQGVRVDSISRQGVVVTVASGIGKKASIRVVPLAFHAPVANTQFGTPANTNRNAGGFGGQLPTGPLTQVPAPSLAPTPLGLAPMPAFTPQR